MRNGCVQYASEDCVVQVDRCFHAYQKERRCPNDCAQKHGSNKQRINEGEKVLARIVTQTVYKRITLSGIVVGHCFVIVFKILRPKTKKFSFW